MYTPDCSLVRPSPLAQALARDLSRELPVVRSSAAEADCVSYARDLWPRHHLATRSGEPGPAASPALVVWPTSTEEVARVVAFAGKRGTPLIPFGAGSGVCGGVLPSPDAIVLDLKRLASVRSVNRETMRLDVDAGVLGLPLEEDLERRSLTLGHFPSSILCSTVGGWVATRSAGQASGYYGKIEDMVVALECVTGEGEIVDLARRRSGPDLTSIVVGSEGALAIVTAATLRIHAAPRERSFGGFTFATVAEGLEAMRAMYQAGLRPAVCRLYDPFDASLARSGKVKRKPHGARATHDAPWREAAMRAVIARSGALNAVVHGALGGRLLGGALLVLVFERSEEGAATSELAHAQVIARSLGGRDEGEGPARRWLAHRYSVSFRQSPALRAGLFIDTFEVAAPWSRLEAAYDAIRRALGKHAFVMAHFSHAYPDGCCIYFSFAGTARPRARAGEFEHSSSERYDAAWRDAMTAAIAAGATIAHHHGVGRSKAAGLEREIEGGVDAMRALKRAFDPHGILNPGVLAAIEDVSPLDARPPAPPADGFIDEISRLALVRGDRSLGGVMGDLRARGWKVHGVSTIEARDDLTTNAWLAQGAPGMPDPFVDPVDHMVAGVEVVLPSGQRVIVPPVPRRATGPDFAALAIGAEGAYGARVERAWIRVEPSAESQASARPRAKFAWNDRSTPSEQERAIIGRVARELGKG